MKISPAQELAEPMAIVGFAFAVGAITVAIGADGWVVSGVGFLFSVAGIGLDEIVHRRRIGGDSR